MTAAESADSDEVPARFVAVTLKRYPCPLVRPVTRQVLVLTPAVAISTVQLAAGAIQENLASMEFTSPTRVASAVYELMGAPPVLAGVVHDTVADVVPGTATTEVGDSGLRAGTALTAVAGALSPFALRATTVTA
jgi:hypothetical protein